MHGRCFWAQDLATLVVAMEPPDFNDWTRWRFYRDLDAWFVPDSVDFRFMSYIPEAIWQLMDVFAKTFKIRALVWWGCGTVI